MKPYLKNSQKHFLPQVILLVLLIFAIASVGCTKYEKNSNGITLVVKKETIPFQEIVWSPTGENNILSIDYSIGIWPAYVYLLDLETGQKQVLAQTNYGSFDAAAWMPDGKNVLILVGDNTQEFEPRGWWKVNVDNKSSEYFMDAGAVTWSSDGKFMATMTGDEAYPNSLKVDLRLTNTDTQTEKTIHTNIESKYNFFVSWSPDSQYLVFPAGQSPSRELYVLNITTQQVVKITENEMADTPVWSPTGNIIAFESSKSTLHLISSDGKCEIEIPNLKNVRSPTWSPDGRKIAFIGEDGIYVLDTDIVFGRDIYQKLCP
jgi:Tol biopolymer transport system component